MMMNVFKATVELCCILLDAGEAAWDAADLGARLQEWWWMVTHSALADSPPTVAQSTGSEWQACYVLNERQENALEMARRLGRLTEAVMCSCWPLVPPGMIGLDLSGLAHIGLLGRDGIYYVLPDAGE